MVFVSGKPVRASDVKVGDKVGDNVVVLIREIQRHGVYAPVTYTGYLMVSGVLVSSYVAILDRFPATSQHFAAHTVMGLHRMLCRISFDICRDERYSDGISNFLIFINQIQKVVTWWPNPMSYSSQSLLALLGSRDYKHLLRVLAIILVALKFLSYHQYRRCRRKANE
jgi:hypothetical protein